MNLDQIRAILDILSNQEADIEQDSEEDCGCGCDDCEEESRFKQVLAMLDADSFGQYSNSPNEIVADVEAVTTDAGGGVNGPKHPGDIRVKDPRGYE
jgi:hypothetical protein